MPAPTSLVNRNNLTNFAASKLGMNYVWGGTSDAGYDCSGLIYKAYESQGVSIPRVAQDQYNASTKVSRENLRPGDSVFFSDTGSTNNVTHTGMYIGNGKYIHAANSSKGVIVSDLPTGGSYFVGGGSFAGGSGSAGSSGSGISANLQAALNGLGAAGQATAMGTTVGDMQFYQAAADAYSAAGSYIVEQVSVKQKILIIIGQIVKVLTLILVFTLAAVLFMKAFDIKAPILSK